MKPWYNTWFLNNKSPSWDFNFQEKCRGKLSSDYRAAIAEVAIYKYSINAFKQPPYSFILRNHFFPYFVKTNIDYFHR